MDEGRNPQSQVERAVPLSYKIYAYATHWLTIVSALAALFAPVFILVNPQNNILNPNIIFGAIFNGASPEEIWELSSTGAFPGAHFYLRYINRADSWAMAFMNLGCGVGFFALVPAVICQIVKERDWFCSFLGILLALLIFFSMTGILSIDS
jgi:hypothetical protein